MTGDLTVAPASAGSPRGGALAGDWRLANAALALHTSAGTTRPEELSADGELHVASPPDTTVSVRLAGVGGIERVGFELNFDSRKIHGDGRAGSVDGLLRIAGAEIRVRLSFELQALVDDARRQQHAVFTTDVPDGD
jgi:hypothetical protein